jgi:PAS domain S-box-containing protein
MPDIDTTRGAQDNRLHGTSGQEGQRSHKEQSGQAKSRLRLAWLPIPLLLLTMDVLWAANLQTPHEFPHLLLALNFVFSTMVSLFVAHLIGRTFLVRGTPGLLLLGCGVLLWGAAGSVGTAIGLLGGFRNEPSVNTLITIHNLVVWLSALCQLGGAVLLSRSASVLRWTGLWLAAAYLAALSTVGMVILATLDGWTPAFFIQGMGGTPLRQFVLISAITMFVLTATLLGGTGRGSSLALRYWYTIALCMIATGLFANLIEKVHASPLSWTGRAAQLLGGVYMLIAAIVSMRETSVWQIPIEEALRTSENRLRLLGDHLPESALYEYVHEPDGRVRFQYFSAGMERLNGVSVDEVLRDAGVLHRQIPPEYLARLVEAEARSALDLSDFDMEVPMRRPDGQVRWMRLHSRPRRMPGGRVVWAGVQTDITERKRAEEENQKSKHLLETFIEFAPAGLAMFDRDMRYVRASKKWQEDTGLRLEANAIEGKSHYELFPGLPEHWKAAHRRGLAGESLHDEEDWVAADGTRRTIRWEIHPWGDSGEEPSGIMIFSEDTTERKRAEGVLQTSLQRFYDVLSNMYSAVLLVTDNGRVEFVNYAFCKLYGLEEAPADLIGIESAALLPMIKDAFLYPEQALVRIQEILERRQPVKGDELTMRNGRTCLRDFVPLNIEGKSRGRLWLHSDITERKRSESRLRHFYETDLFAILYWSIEGGVIDVNDQFLKMTGYTREDLRAGLLNWARMTPPEYQALDEDARRQIQETGVHLPYEKEFIRKDGRRIWGLFSAAAWEDNRNQGVSFILDITERKRAEQALLRSEKLASAGRMAATIAHEINNPLGAVTNLLFIAKETPGLPDSARHYLEIADAELRRIAHIARQSLGFYRESNAPALTSVNSVLESSIDVLKSRIQAKHPVIEKRYKQDVELTAVAGELRQVFSNLLANSLDAIDDQGTIQLRVSTATAFKDSPRRVRITIADNGNGIPAESRRHLFEPFFTTKGAVGTGLGLWVSKQIIDKHGGTIRVRSATQGQRRGTVFSVLLPAEPSVTALSQSAGEGIS